jgi:RNA polymerase-interacting CarD/CdnL/TRCF family regulator
MKFKNGDFVVHPQHGVGQVVALSEREFTPGTKQPYYEIAIAGGSVWVPVDLSISGLRGLAVKSEITHCRQILEASPSPLSEDARYRRSEQAARLKQGTLQAQCEVVRDLYAFGEHRSMNGTIGSFYQAVRDALCQEWAFVEGITRTQAVMEIDRLLEKSRETLKRSNALAGG